MADSAGEHLMQSWLLGARLATEIQQRVYLLGFSFGSLDCKSVKKAQEMHTYLWLFLRR